MTDDFLWTLYLFTNILQGNLPAVFNQAWVLCLTHCSQGWGEYYSGTRLGQNDKHEYTKNIVLEYYSSTDFPVLVLVCSVLAPALIVAWWHYKVT